MAAARSSVALDPLPVRYLNTNALTPLGSVSRQAESPDLFAAAAIVILIVFFDSLALLFKKACQQLVRFAACLESVVMVTAAVAFPDSAVKNNTAVYPPKLVFDRGVLQLDAGDAVRPHEKAWRKLKTP